MQTSGLILDVYDDFNGEVLRSIFPNQSDVPELVKSAHALDSAQREQLPDDAYALVMLNEGQKIRKFACVDRGNTELSVKYFLKNAHKLPEQAQKHAAVNLIEACGWYDMAVPEQLEKIAVVGGALRFAAKHPGTVLHAALVGPEVVKGTKQGIQQNMDVIRAGEAQGGISGGLGAMHHRNLKVAEVTGTQDMSLSAPSGRPYSPPAAGTVRKTGGFGEVVDVSDSSTEKAAQARSTELYALPSEQKYPIDSYAQVKEAAAYFGEYGKRMAPEHRREFCVNLVKRASDLAIHVDEDILKYGSEKLASAQELELSIFSRMNVLADEDNKRLLEKVASIIPTIAPEEAVTLLGEFDKEAHIDHLYDQEIMDPYYSVYGSKVAEDAAEYSEVIGNLMVTGRELEALAKTKYKSVASTFGHDMAEEFRKDPVSIYKSLPVDQRKMLIRMANENSPGQELLR